ncbi:MAG: 5-(carboxyamino)imidazole ribonucleotide synthase [Gammaproteobacteria bacterium]|nr:5-(carboxyamino)imidazole ribonucleotide synthase [Gammaproteobacteria bacterium]
MITIGIVGGGQLARMLVLAGLPLGLRFVVLDPAADACGAAGAEHLCSPFDDRAALDQLAQRCDVVTYEFENIPAEAMAHLAAQVPVYPKPQALAISRDRLTEKNLFRELGIDLPAYFAVDSKASLEAVVALTGLPAVLKTRTLGYDGKGQFVLRTAADVDTAWQQLGKVPLILEGFVPFDREISVVAVRSRDGEVRTWPISENVHQAGILRQARSMPEDAFAQQAGVYARRILQRLDYVGVMALELFCVGDRLLVNEMAPRVHNSGHWTIEGAATSQFENHIRAVAGWPLGSTAAQDHAAMVNFIGAAPTSEAVLALTDVHLHDYGKAPRAGRKIGHATVHSVDRLRFESQLAQLKSLADAVAC